MCKALPTASNILLSFYSTGGSANRKKLSIAKPSRVFITSGFIASLKSIEQPQSVGFGFFLFISSPNVDPFCFCCHDISLQSKGQHGVKRDPGIWPDYWGIGASRKFYWELSFFFKTKHRFKLGFDHATMLNQREVKFAMERTVTCQDFCCFKILSLGVASTGTIRGQDRPHRGHERDIDIGPICDFSWSTRQLTLALTWAQNEMFKTTKRLETALF